ncbi:hypothetical protein ABH977_008277 [Bradyrhizobium ottawaense]
MPSLFDPMSLGARKAPNRIIMAPLTRSRATRDYVPTKMMVEYYAQRASAGAYHQRGHRRLSSGQWLYLHAGALVRRAGARLETRDPRRASER